MDITYTAQGEAKILMKQYIDGAIEAFPKDCSAEALSAAAAHLFEVNKNCKRLLEAHRRILHSITAKLLFIAKRARPDTSSHHFPHLSRYNCRPGRLEETQTTTRIHA